MFWLTKIVEVSFKRGSTSYIQRPMYEPTNAKTKSKKEILL